MRTYLRDLSFVRLQTAVFCVDCELISENSSPACLACGSRAVLSLARVLGGSLRGQQTAHLIAETLTGATGAAIALRKGDEIVCRARSGRTAPDVGMRLQTDSGISADCVRTGEVVLCHDAEMNPQVDLAACRRLGVRSILAAPLRHFRRTLGVFEVLSGVPHAFDNGDVATMQMLSSMMVAAISRLSTLRPAASQR